MDHRQLLPRSDITRWQVYPSDDEVLLLKMLTKYAGIEKEIYMIRIMINYFAENNEQQLNLVKYAQTYIRPKYDVPSTRTKKKVAVATNIDKYVSKDIMEEVNRLIDIIQELKMPKNGTKKSI